MTVSFEEKSVWIQLGSVALALTGYLYVAAPLLSQGHAELSEFLPVFCATIVALVVVLVVGHVVAAATGDTEERDERDRLVLLRANSGSAWVLALGINVAMAAMFLAAGDAVVANLLLGSLFLSQLAKYGLQLFLYRRGF